MRCSVGQAFKRLLVVMRPYLTQTLKKIHILHFKHLERSLNCSLLFLMTPDTYFSSGTTHQPYEACSETNVKAPVRLQPSQLPAAFSNSYSFRFSLLRGWAADRFYSHSSLEFLSILPSPFLQITATRRKTQSRGDARKSLKPVSLDRHRWTQVAETSRAGLTERKLILYKEGQTTVSKPSGRVH